VPVWSRIIARGPLIGAVEARWSMKSAGNGELSARLVVALHADSPVVRLRLDIENQATGHRLRARFPVGVGAEAMAGGAFGVESRPAVIVRKDPGAIEQPVSTAPAQRFVAAGEGARGLAVLAPGFFEYEWTARHDLFVTLLRSVGELSRNDLPERPGHAAWPEPTPLAEELGTHIIELALVAGPIANPEQLEQHWEDAFLPVMSLFERIDRR
jgi:alpha-mannosidase